MVVFPLLNILTRAFDETGQEVFSNILTSEVVEKLSGTPFSLV